MKLLPKRTLFLKVNKKNTARWAITKPPPTRVNPCRDESRGTSECKMGRQNGRLLFFGESETGIKALIAAYKDQKTLEYSTAFKQFAEETLSEKSSLLWIGNIAKLKKENDTQAFWKALDTEKFPYAAFQGVVENDFMHLHFRLHYSEKELSQS